MKQGIPTRWLESKGVQLADGDIYSSEDDGVYILSFTGRPSPGECPFVPFLISYDAVEFVPATRDTEIDWTLVKSWKPDHKLMLKQYQSEQGAKQMSTKAQDYYEQESEQADFAKLVIDNGKRACYFYRKTSGVYVEKLCPDRKIWCATLTTMNDLFKDELVIDLSTRSDDNKEQAHHIAIMIEKLGNQPANHIDLSIGGDAVQDVRESRAFPSGHYASAASKADLKYHDIDEDGKMTPVFTQAMADTRQLPPIGSLVDYEQKKSYDNKNFVYYGQSINNFLILESVFNNGMIKCSLDQVKPIDNRTEGQKVRDNLSVLVSGYVSAGEECDIQHYVDELMQSFSITLNKE